MFGNKLRAWMDAVRPKKKQHRKEKQGKQTTFLNDKSTSDNHTVTWKHTSLIDSEKSCTQEAAIKYVKPHIDKTNDQSRYSAANLSSPESAYSTGYSTDGTSPGAPPEYSLHLSDKKIGEKHFESRLSSDLNTPLTCSYKTPKPCLSSPVMPIKIEERESDTVSSSGIFFENVPTGLVSPRQRNRIRTNPWLPGGITSTVQSPLPARQATISVLKSYKNSPIQHRYLSPIIHRRSLSSSSCSSLSGTQNVQYFEQHFPRSFSDEDDCTLNEMMGKFDESYIYEKETDILSDSDPTDCESDIDTGQDGGDEDDNVDLELDFIDNGSYVELDNKINNTGHCLYYIPSIDIQRKKSSRRRTARKSKEPIEKRRRPSSSKKCLKHSVEKARHWSLHQNGSKSAGATPVSVRKSKATFYKMEKECLKMCSDSGSIQKDSTVLIDKRDREADLKYRELIGQAEQIIRTMNINGLSPRRIPGPTNKRVELLRTAECAKPELLFRNKNTDDTFQSNITPSTAIFKNNRFSPKKNHITNFINSNSPTLLRKEVQAHQSPNAIRRTLPEDVYQPSLVLRKKDISRKNSSEEPIGHSRVLKKTTSVGTPATPRKNHQPKGILQKVEHSYTSPRHRRAIEMSAGSSSSEEERFQRTKKKLFKTCPQSEPMKRKVYFGRNTVNISRGNEKTVLSDRTNETLHVAFEPTEGSTENLRHQVLLNTIQCLKRNLEDQSASLQKTYRSTQNIF